MSQTAGSPGPVSKQEHHLVEMLAHQIRGRIPGRIFRADVSDDGERDRLNRNMAGGVAPCTDAVKERWLAVQKKVHPDYEDALRRAMQTGQLGDPSLTVTDTTPIRAHKVPKAARTPRRPF